MPFGYGTHARARGRCGADAACRDGGTNSLLGAVDYAPRIQVMNPRPMPVPSGVRRTGMYSVRLDHPSRGRAARAPWMSSGDHGTGETYCIDHPLTIKDHHPHMTDEATT